MFQAGESGVKNRLCRVTRVAEIDRSGLPGSIRSGRKGDTVSPFRSLFSKRAPEQFISDPLSGRMNRIAISGPIGIVLIKQGRGVIGVQDISELVRVLAEVALRIGGELVENGLSRLLFVRISHT